MPDDVDHEERAIYLIAIAILSPVVVIAAFMHADFDGGTALCLLGTVLATLGVIRGIARPRRRPRLPRARARLRRAAP